MITSSQARINSNSFHLIEYMQFLSTISTKIDELSSLGYFKLSLSVPFSIHNSKEKLSELQQYLTDPPNNFKVSFYENNTKIVISWE